MTVQTYTRIAGVLMLLSIVAGGFGEAYVPSRLMVSGDAAATAQNLKALDFLFRLGFAGFLVESVCDTALSLILYVLLRRVNKDLALLAAFFGLIGTALFAVAELFYFAASLILKGGGYLQTFPPDQLNTLALLSLKLFGLGAAIFTVYYGMAWIVRRILDLSIRLPSEVSRRSYDDRWSWVCVEELPVGPCTDIRIRLPSHVDIPGGTVTDDMDVC
jgi:hypothetical protein